jgi:hypothetical protein
MDKKQIQTFTLTYGNCAENHKSMEIIGKQLDSGLDKNDLDTARKYFENLGAKCELIELKKLIKDHVSKENFDKISDAYLLVVRKGVKHLLGQEFKNFSTDSLYMEQEELEKDKKAFMYGRVVNKKARHNLCFSDFDQEADFENKKGTVVNFNQVKYTNKIRLMIPDIIPNEKVKNLHCEGNYYYDVKSTYIGMHGDTERQIVIAVRLGANFNLYYQWYHSGKKVGSLYEITLEHGDMYFMSDKAVGYDWKKSSLYTLRHGAGPRELIGLGLGLVSDSTELKSELIKQIQIQKTDDTKEKKIINKKILKFS